MEARPSYELPARGWEVRDARTLMQFHGPDPEDPAGEIGLPACALLVGPVGGGRVDPGADRGKPKRRGGEATRILRTVSGLADGAEEFVAGTLDGLGGFEVGGCGGQLVERVEGDGRPEEVFGAGHGFEPLVGCGDVFLPVASLHAAVGDGDLGGEEAGPVEIEEGAEVIAEEGVDLRDEPFLDSTSALSFEWRGRDLVKVGMWSSLRRM